MNVEPIKHKQHYVFQSYLSNWASNNQIWTRRNGKCFKTNTLNVAQERDFYRVKDINEDELRLLSYLWSNHSKETTEFLFKQIKSYQRPLLFKEKVERCKSFILSRYKHRPISPNITNAIQDLDHQCEKYINDLIEDLHCDEEGLLIERIKCLIQDDTRFYYEPSITNEIHFGDTKRAFLYCFCSQHYRTKSAKARLIKSLEAFLNNDFSQILDIDPYRIRPDHIFLPLYWEICGILTDHLYSNNAHLTLLHNNTDLHLITSDQPIINLNADYKNHNESISGMEFYYPITPTLAITLNDTNIAKTRELTLDDVNYFNSKIAAASYEFIFADSDSLLTKYS